MKIFIDSNVLIAAYCIVSGDDDLLVLKKVHNIPIVSPHDFWKFEENHSRFLP
jgi:predicted nucleic acid-binding protein